MRAASIAALLVLLVVVIGVLDVLTGSDVGFALLYLTPVAYAALRLGLAPALGIAVEAYVAWFVADAITRPDQLLLVSVWNAVTRLVIFTTTAALISSVERERATVKELAARRHEFTKLLGSDLRALAASMRAEGGQGPERVELGALARQAVADTDSARVDLAGDGSAAVLADAERVEHAISAVLSSALRRTRGDVWVAVRERDDEVGLEVTARGDGWITKGDDDADLRIPRLVANLYDGHVDIRQGDAGTTVTLAFPRAV